MAQFFLGADIGGTKTHAVVADARGRAVGFGESGPGNHESVGYDGLLRVVQAACGQASRSAGVTLDQIAGAGFGIAGYDWLTQKEDHLRTLGGLGLRAPLQIVNDTILGLVAGSPEGWGVAVVSGTGCNCWGWNRERTREGRVTGFGILMGEGAGGSELMFRAVQAVSYEWTRRGPATALSQAFITYTGAAGLDDLAATREKELGDVYAPSLRSSGEPPPEALRAAPEVRYVDAISDGLREAMRRNPNILLLGQDIAEYGGAFKVTEGFLAEFGKDRVRNTPIIESGANPA
jgi:N-acetylglucosamine kinase-like BadF-type ATPase